MVVFGLAHVVDSDPLLDLSVDIGDTPFVFRLLLFYLLPKAITA